MLKAKKGPKKTQVQEDKLFTATIKAQLWYENNKKNLLIGLVSIVVLGLIITGVMWSKKSAAENSSFDELMARDAYSRADLDETVRLSDVLIEQYAGTHSAGVGLTLKAKVHQQRGEMTQAIELYNEVVSKYGKDKYLTFGALYSLGNIYRSQGRSAEAADHYQRAAIRYPDHFQAAVALVDAGQAYEKASKYEDAKRMYRLVVSKYPDSRSIDTARKNLTLLEFMD